MPIYEYQCRSCGERREVLQRISDPPLEICDECGGEVRKLISAPAFQFKGSGWYVTDYARKGQSGGAEASGSNGDTSDSGGAKTADAKGSETKSKDAGTSKSGSGSAGSTQPPT